MDYLKQFFNHIQSLAYELITTMFCIIVVLSCIISSKFVHLPFLKFEIPAGLMTYPLTFLLSDLVTEIYGPKKSKSMVLMAFAMTLFSYSILKISLILPTQDTEVQRSFEKIIGMNGIIIFSSLIAYLVSQTLDIHSYSYIKQKTKDKHLWARSNGSTLLAQIADTATVNIIHLYFGLGMAFSEVCQIMIFSYFYKFFFSIINTPFFYFLVFGLKKINRDKRNIL